MIPAELFQDLMTIGLLVFLEGILSIDNALVLALLAKPLPPEQRKKALTYGLVGAFVFRFFAIFIATHLLKWTWVKFAGGGYLVFIAVKHFIESGKSAGSDAQTKPRGFWRTILVIEITDIAFAIDSILAAVALTNKFWIIFTGGVLGMIMMRYAATMFLGILEKFPRFETTAFLLVFVIGFKVILEGLRIPGIDFHNHSAAPFWIFWAVMVVCIGIGFLPKKNKKSSTH